MTYIPQDLMLPLAIWLALVLVCAVLLTAVGWQAVKPPRFHSPRGEIDLNVVTRHRGNPYAARSVRLTGLVTT